MGKQKFNLIFISIQLSDHISSTLEDSIRGDTEILQLSGNVRIENLLLDNNKTF